MHFVIKSKQQNKLLEHENECKHFEIKKTIAIHFGAKKRVIKLIERLAFKQKLLLKTTSKEVWKTEPIQL